MCHLGLKDVQRLGPDGRKTLYVTAPVASQVQPATLIHIVTVGIHTGFSGKGPDFSAKRRIFLQIHRNTLENSKVHPIRRRVRRTETDPILETFLFLITARRFGGVGAPEGREKVPDHIFLEVCNCVSGGRLWNQPYFSAKLCFWRKIMDG